MVKGEAMISLLKALERGFIMKCPNCGRGHLFGGFLKVVDGCEVCSEDFTPQRADDFPAYLVGNIELHHAHVRRAEHCIQRGCHNGDGFRID